MFLQLQSSSISINLRKLLNGDVISFELVPPKTSYSPSGKDDRQKVSIYAQYSCVWHPAWQSGHTFIPY